MHLAGERFAGVRVELSDSVLTARAGVVAVAQLLKRHAQLPQILDPKFPVPGGFSDSTVAITYICQLAQDVTAFDSIENMRRDPSFAAALKIHALPSAPTVRQRIEARATDWLMPLSEANVRMLERARIELKRLPSGRVPLNGDVTVLRNDRSEKEDAGYTYQRTVGFAPLALYLGSEGYLLELALRPGTQHSALESDYALERVVPMARRLTDAPLLVRLDSGFDSQRIYRVLDEARVAGELDYLVKWNPRKRDLEAIYAARLTANSSFVETREGLSYTLWREPGAGQFRLLKLSVQTIDRSGQRLLLPKLKLEGWNTTLGALEDQAIIDLYAAHGTHEQFHAEIKSDLNFERLPSGKFDANDCVCSLEMLAYNALRIIGQQALNGMDSPVRHPADRRRMKTTLREFIDTPGRLIRHARQTILAIPRHWAGAAMFQRFMQGALFAAAAPQAPS